MRIKKIVLSVLAVFVLLSLAGCNMLSQLSNAESESLQESEESESAEVATQGTETTTEMSPSEESNIIDFTVSPVYNAEYDQTTYEQIAYNRYDKIMITSDTLPELKEAINSWSDKMAEASESTYEEYRQLAIEDSKDTEIWMEGSYYTDESQFMVRRADSSVFSIMCPTYSFSGGAHGYYGVSGWNFDSQTGKEILIEDVITDTQKFCEAVEEEYLKYYSADDLLAEGDFSEYLMQNYFAEEQEYEISINFLVTQEGIMVIFNPYEITAYAMGQIKVNLKKSDYPDLLVDKYFTDVPDDYMFMITKECSGEVDINSDGIYDSIIYGGTMDDYGTWQSVNVSVNGVETSYDIYSSSTDAYYVKSNGKSYIYIQASGESDYRSVVVFDINGETPLFIGEIEGNLSSCANPHKFVVGRRMDVLSTYEGSKKCYVGEDGLPQSDIDEYAINIGLTLKSTVDLTGELLDETTRESLGETTVPAGSEFEFVASDNQTYIIFRVADIGLVKYSVTLEWPQTINGADAEQCFEELYFAG